MPATSDVDGGRQRHPSDPTGLPAELRLHILGPLRVWRGAVELDPGPPQQAALLAVLLARAGRPCSTDELSSALWGEESPPSALNTIHRYVGALRHLLEPGLARRAVGSYVQRRGNGYVCTAGADVLDLLEFRREVEWARSALSGGRRAHALDHYVQALGLWSGPAGTGLSRASNATSVFVTLNAEFLDACASAADLAISLEQPERALPALRAAVAIDPFHEPLHARLAVALGAAGRHAEALSVLRGVRVRLAEELGLDPGEMLQAAERAVLHPSRTRRAGPEVGGRPTPGRGVDTLRTGLVGRLDELATLWAAASQALAGGSSIALIEGEPGIGKTRLLDAVCAEAERAHMLVAGGRCSQGDGAPALSPWMEVLAAVAELLPSHEGASARPGALHQLTEPDSWIGATQVIPDIGARFRLFQRIAVALGHVSKQRPILLAMDDLQWADAASLQLFGHLAARLPPGVCLLGALRDRAPAIGPDLAGALADASRSRFHRRIRLTALSPSEVVALVHHEVGSALDHTDLHRLHERTAGNPFFVVELARLLATVEDRPGASAAPARVPSTVLDVVRDRTAHLDEETRVVLQVAAVIGTEFDVGVLAQAVGMPEQTCIDRCQQVADLGLIGPCVGDPRKRRFAHDIVRDSVVEAAPGGRVPRMHADVADALERAANGTDAAVERVAYHLWSAGPLADAGRTAAALVRAGRAAAAKCAFESAERDLQSAAQMAREAGLPELELAALAQLIAAVGMSSGYVGSAMELLERAEALARQLGRDREAADFLFSRYVAYAQGIQLDRAGRLARVLLDHGEASTDPMVAAYGSAAWGIHLWDVGHIGEARHHLAHANSIVQDGDTGGDGWQLRRDLRLLWPVWLAFTTALHGRVDVARSILDQMDDAVADEPYGVTVWATFSVVVAALAGDTGWAADAAGRGVSADPDWSYSFLGSYQRVGLCWAKAMSGDRPVEMATQAAEIIAANMECPPRSGLPTWYCLLAEMWLGAAQLDHAARALDKVDEYLVSYGQRYAEGLVLLLRARLLHARGAPTPEVRAAARRARDLSIERGAHLFARRAEEFLDGLPGGQGRRSPADPVVHH